MSDAAIVWAAATWVTVGLTAIAWVLWKTRSKRINTDPEPPDVPIRQAQFTAPWGKRYTVVGWLAHEELRAEVAELKARLAAPATVVRRAGGAQVGDGSGT
jgi:hypothetical protein